MHKLTLLPRATAGTGNVMQSTGSQELPIQQVLDIRKVADTSTKDYKQVKQQLRAA